MLNFLKENCCCLKCLDSPRNEPEVELNPRRNGNGFEYFNQKPGLQAQSNQSPLDSKPSQNFNILEKGQVALIQNNRPSGLPRDSGAHAHESVVAARHAQSQIQSASYAPGHEASAQINSHFSRPLAQSCFPADTAGYHEHSSQIQGEEGHYPLIPNADVGDLDIYGSPLLHPNKMSQESSPARYPLMFSQAPFEEEPHANKRNLRDSGGNLSSSQQPNLKGDVNSSKRHSSNQKERNFSHFKQNERPAQSDLIVMAESRFIDINGENRNESKQRSQKGHLAESAVISSRQIGHSRNPQFQSAVHLPQKHKFPYLGNEVIHEKPKLEMAASDNEAMSYSASQAGVFERRK